MLRQDCADSAGTVVGLGVRDLWGMANRWKGFSVLGAGYSPGQKSN